MGDGSAEIDESHLTELLSLVWNTVITHVNKLCEAHSKYGSFKFHLGLNPSLQEVIEGFDFVDKTLMILLDSKKLTFDETRDALNSRQCILKMKELAVACEEQLIDQIDGIIKELRLQSKF